MYNASERKDIRKAEKAALLADKQRMEIVTGIMSVVPGRQWMVEHLALCHVFSSSFSPDHGVMAFREGERNVGLRLLNDIMQACPQYYTLMMQERNERDAAGRSTAPKQPRGEDPYGGVEDSGDDDSGDDDPEPGGSREINNYRQDGV